MRILFALILCLTAVPAFAQNEAPVTFIDGRVGTFWWNGGNEVLSDSKIPDASKFRVGAPMQEGESGGGGAFSFDVIGGIPGPAPKRVEAVLLTGGMNRDGGGESGFFILKKGTWGDINDSKQIRIWEATSERMEFKVPISAPNLTAGGMAANYFDSQDGRFRVVQQNDGNLVQYEQMGGHDNLLCPRWSTFTGTIPKGSSPEQRCN